MFWDRSIHCVEDARALAKRRLPWIVFDLIDGAAGSGAGEISNRNAIRDIKLRPRVFKDVADRSVKTELFGKPTNLPFGIAPMGMCNLSAPGADLMLARLAAKHNIPVGVSIAASTPMEKMIETAAGNAWFQLYYSSDESICDGFLDRAKNCGYEVLVFTADVAEVGRRPSELRRGFKIPFKIGFNQFVDFAMHPEWSFKTLLNGPPGFANFDGSISRFERSASRAGADWEFLKRLRERWKGKLVVKGVLDPEDALQLKKCGVDAIQVSSHGGRQMESAPLAIHALANIRTAVGSKFPLFYDSGIRSGEDIVKAYAMGADFVMLGRPWQFAIAADGEQGLTRFCDVLGEELSITLALLGLNKISDINQSVLLPA